MAPRDETAGSHPLWDRMLQIAPTDYFVTLTMSAPQVHLPGFWLMVSHLQFGPQPHVYLPTVLNVLALSHESALTSALPGVTFRTFALAISEPHVQFPGLRDMVLHGHFSPQLQV